MQCVYSISCVLNVLYCCCNIGDAEQNCPFVVCAACCERMTCHLGHLICMCSVFREAWDNIAKKCLFYKLLQRHVLFLYADHGWYMSKTVWTIGIWVLFAMGVAYSCKPDNWGTPLFVGLTGLQIVWAYKVVLEARKNLIPLNCILETTEDQEVSYNLCLCLILLLCLLPSGVESCDALYFLLQQGPFTG